MDNLGSSSRIKDVRSSRMARTIALAAVATCMTTAPAAALTIVPHFGTGGAAFNAAQLTALNNAINFYQTTFSDPVTVHIGFFNMTSGLGQSLTWQYGGLPYTDLRAALVDDATTADDATALASLPGANPLTGTFLIKSALGRALGFNTTPSTGNLVPYSADCGVSNLASLALDSCIGINTGLTTTNAPQAGQYNFLSVIEHEVDEALGMGSGLRGTSSTNNSIEDLFRYSANGVRSHTAGSACGNSRGPLAYFSIDGGASNLARYNNCNNGGDYGDWNEPSDQVQNAFGTPGGSAFLGGNSTELRALDVIGWDRVSTVPEPSTFVLLTAGLTFVGGMARRRKNAA